MRAINLVLRSDDGGREMAAAMASYVPARRATAVDPVETLSRT